MVTNLLSVCRTDWMTEWLTYLVVLDWLSDWLTDLLPECDVNRVATDWLLTDG